MAEKSNTLDQVIITITKWTDHNPRKDLKSMPWIRLDNDLPYHEDCLDFDAEDMWIWTFLLLHAAKKMNPTFMLGYRFLSRFGKVSEKKAREAIRRIEKAGWISISVATTNGSDRIRTDPDGSVPYERTNITNEHNEQTNPVFDFESLYKKYPRRIGKKKGIEKCEATIKSQAELESLSKAIDRYAAHCAKEKTEEKYIKHFSTFMSCWSDWAEFDAGLTVAAISCANCARGIIRAINRSSGISELTACLCPAGRARTHYISYDEQKFERAS